MDSTVQGINRPRYKIHDSWLAQDTVDRRYSAARPLVFGEDVVRYRRRIACSIRERPRSGAGNRSTSWMRPVSVIWMVMRGSGDGASSRLVCSIKFMCRVASSINEEHSDLAAAIR